MATSKIKEMKPKNKHIGFISCANYPSITVPLERTQGGAIHAEITVINGNANVLANVYTGSSTRVRNWGGVNLVATDNGTDVVLSLETGETLWGCTLVIVAASYDLSWGG